MDNVIFVDYIVSRECKDFEAFCYGTCHKCGKCGRMFNENGMMIDSGGTHTVSVEDME